MWSYILILGLMVGTLFAPPAFAQSDNARAIELIAKANTAYDAGDFRGALEDYREAYDVTGDPRVLYRIGITYENLANYQRAEEHLELFLLADADSKYADRVKTKIESLRSLEANLQAAIRVESQPPGASIWLDTERGRPTGVAPVRLPVGPGEHTLLIRKEGFEDVRDTINVAASETVSKTYDLGGGTVVEASPEITEPVVEAPVEEVADETAIDPAMLGETTNVRIGPSTGISVLSWFCIAAGWSLIVTSGIASQALFVQDSVVGAGVLTGAGLVALGSYFLWFRDYTRDLPPATALKLRDLPTQRVLGIGVKF